LSPLRVFIGADSRQPLAYTVCRSSIERYATQRVIIEKLDIRHMPIKRTGLTEFTFSRFLVPHLCGYTGIAVFVDADFIARADITGILPLLDPAAAVSVVKNPLHYEWPSLMVFNNALCQKLTPDYVANGNPFSFEWAPVIGGLPSEWNHLVGYDKPRSDAKMVHFTQGIPCWPETEDCEYAEHWNRELEYAGSTVSWQSLMGDSVHAAPVMQRLKGKK